MMRLSRTLSLALFVSVVCISTATPALAEVPYFEFTQALRDRGHHRTALEYLDMLKEKDVPAEVKERLPFEEAVIRIDLSRQEKSAKGKNLQLMAAKSALETFLKGIPDDHPLAGQANSELATILMGRAKVAVIQSRDPANVSERFTLQEEARTLVMEARTILEKARDRYQAEFDKFPTFIPATDRKQFNARNAVETDLLRSKLDYATTFYEEAKTYDEDNPLYKTALETAANEFEQLHTRYRSLLVGLYARMWMGKCFEEQGEIGKALGFYNELLSHPGTSPAMQRLQDDVRHFRLICLNHPTRRDYVLAYQEANDWLARRRNRASTQTGLGIRWEKARAAELLGLTNALPIGVMDFVEMSYSLAGVEETIPRGEQEEFFGQAIDEAAVLATIPSLYQQPAQEMVRRLEGVLNRTGGDPQDFNTADSLSAGMLRKIQRTQKKLRATRDNKARTELQTELQRDLQEGTRYARIGLRLADASVPDLLVQELRRRLAYFLFQTGDYYEAAAVSGFVARTTPAEHSVGLESAYLEMAAWVRTFNQAGDDKQFELDSLIAACELITQTWPGSERAIDARMQLGDLYRTMNEPEQAAKWYLEVPESSPRYSEAQIKAGQAYLTTYLELSLQGDATKEQLDKWESKARANLETGTQLMSEQVTESAKPPEILTAARLSLVQILARNGEYQEAEKLLTEGNHAIIEAVQVELPPGVNFDPDLQTKRPEKGVQSREFAGLAYQMLLRCHIGTQQIEKARGTMEDLEAVLGGSDSDALFAAYEELGRELQQEITRLKEQGETKQLDDLRNSFDLFLNRLYEGKDSAKFGTLAWIGQTYQSLGDGIAGSDDATETDLAQAKPYYEKAIDTYKLIVERSNNPAFVDPKFIPAVKLRLVKSQRKARQFQEAYNSVVALLQENAYRQDVQIEAATLLQQWGTSDTPDATAKLKEALGKDLRFNPDLVVWGWGGIVSKIQQIIEQERRTGEYDVEAHEKRKEALLDARLHLDETQLAYAKSLEKGKRQGALQQARSGILSFVNLYGPMPQEWYDRFNALYAKLQTEMGVEVEDLPVIEETSAPEPIAVADAGPQPDDSQKNDDKTSPSASDEDSGGGALWMILGLLVAIVCGVGTFIAMNNSSKRRRRRR